MPDKSFEFPPWLENELFKYRDSAYTPEETKKFVFWVIKKSEEEGVSPTGIIDAYDLRYGLPVSFKAKTARKRLIHKGIDYWIESGDIVFSDGRLFSAEYNTARLINPTSDSK